MQQVPEENLEKQGHLTYDFVKLGRPLKPVTFKNQVSTGPSGDITFPFGNKISTSMDTLWDAASVTGCCADCLASRDTSTLKSGAVGLLKHLG